MQTTLLGLALAVILALVAALVGPLLIDWGTYRSAIDREASRLVGLDVRVTGAIDARLLPSPRLVLHDIEIGRAGDDTLRARSLGIEFALAPLMRGEWRASDMALSGLDIKLGLDATGHVQAPNIALRFNADALSIDRLSITDSRITLTDAASGANITLDSVSFNGEMRSLFGPFTGEGAVRADGALYPYRVSAGRIGDDGAVKLHVNIDPAARPFGIEADGMLTLAGGTPQFDGTLGVSRPAGIAPQGGALMQPWRIAGKLKVSAASALMEQIEFQYGSEDLGAKLTGTAEFKFGPHPHFDSVVSGRQIDLDRGLAQSDASPPSPVKAVRALIDATGGALPPSVPVQIGIGIDEVTLGGNTIQTLRGDISSDTQGWSFDHFEFRAPGFTQVNFSGRIAPDGGTPAFNGPADVQSSDPLVFAAWLQGRPPPQPGDTRPLRLRGDMTLGTEKVAIERLNAEFDRKPVTGRFVYVFGAAGHRPLLDAELQAADLDVDAALGVVNALVAGSDVERPHDIALSLDIARATVAGMDARDA
ncbi:MAG TPA: AsmA family protein, partial [Pseudolabrys sp.]|nr:AsmA family protein [Pseudolabrys sp.]